MSDIEIVNCTFHDCDNTLEFDIWWSKQNYYSGRVAALAAWKYQQSHIKELESALQKVNNGLDLDWLDDEQHATKGDT